MEGSQEKAYVMHTRRVDTSKYVRKKVPFCIYFIIFSFTRYFHHTTLIYNTFAIIIFLSLSCFIVLSSIQLLSEYLKIFSLEMARGETDGDEYVRNGGRCKHAFAYNEGRGQSFAIFVHKC